MRPCIVCGNTTSGELNRHHLLPKAVRTSGTRQITVKLCREDDGCGVHKRFHEGDKEAAVAIRENLLPKEIQWMVEQVGSKWVKTIYPTRTTP